MIWIILIGIALMYFRVWNYLFLIDDIVRRWDYLYVVPETSPHPSFYSTRPHPWRRLFPVITHAMNTIVVYWLFGWQCAALFAFSPISVNGAAWITGGYYSVTCFLTLAAYYFITVFPNIVGGFMSSLFFTAALGSTITCIGIPFMFLLTGSKWGLMLFWPLAFYLGGRRFVTGFKIRNDGKKDKIHFRKIAVMSKVMAYYIRINLVPDKLAFFRSFGGDYLRYPECKKELESFDANFWASLLLNIVFFTAGWIISPVGILFFYVSLLPFSQWKLLGQFIAERYLYLPNVGICLLLATALQSQPILFAAVLGLYIWRTHKYIPAWESVETLYLHGIQNYPECTSNYANYGERMLHIGKQKEAHENLRKIIDLDEKSFLAHTNLAAFWVSVKDWENALKHTILGIKCSQAETAINRILGQQLNELRKMIFEVEKQRVRGAKEEKNVQLLQPAQ